MRYKIGTYKRWGHADYFTIGDSLSGANYGGLGHKFTGRGKELYGIYYGYYNINTASKTTSYLNWWLASVTGSGTPGTILGSSGAIALGTEDAWNFRDIPNSAGTGHVTLNSGVNYCVYCTLGAGWGTKSAHYTTYFCKQPLANGIIHVSSGESWIATTDPNFDGITTPPYSLSPTWSDRNAMWPIMCRNTDESLYGHGYLDEYQVTESQVTDYFPVFYNDTNRKVVGAGYSYWYGATNFTNVGDLRFRIIEGRDNTDPTDIVGTSFTIKHSAYFNNLSSAYVSTSLSEASIYPASGGILLEAGKWYTVGFYSCSAYPTRIGGTDAHIYSQLATTLTYDSGNSYVYKKSTTTRKTTHDFPYYLEVEDYYSLASVYGYVYYSDYTKPIQNGLIDIYYSGELQMTTTSDASGYYEAIASTGGITLIPRKYDFDFNPQYYNINLQNKTEQLIYASSQSKWWSYSSPTGKGSLFAFRDLISFTSNHGTIPKGYTVKIEFPTGYQERFATSAYFNESIQHSMGQGIIYCDGKIHACYLATGAGVRVATKDETTKEITVNRIFSKSGVAVWDTHYYPNLVSNKNNYIYVGVAGHNSGKLDLLKSVNPNDLSVMESSVDLLFTDNNAYPRFRCDNNNWINCLFRWYVGGDAGLKMVRFNEDVSTVIPMGYVAYYDNAEAAGNASIYICGFKIDSDNVIHCAFNYFDNYLIKNTSRAIGYMYSPPNVNGIATPGYYWFNAKGHTCSISTGHGYTDLSSVLGFMDDGENPEYNPFVIYSWDSSQTYYNAKKYYHGNTESMFIHPNKRINNGIHNIHMPYFTFHAYPNIDAGGNDINREVEGFLAYYDPESEFAQTGVVGEGWVVSTVTHTAKSVNGTGQLAWKGRHWGGMAIDNTPEIHIYGFIKPSGKNWFGGELCEWTSVDDGATWKHKLITNNSGYGIGMLSVKPDFSNDSIELVYGRGYDIMYYSDVKKYDRIREDGEDIRVVYSGASSNAIELSRLNDFMGMTNTNLYFTIQHTIPANTQYDTAGNYYIYYGRYDTTDASGQF